MSSTTWNSIPWTLGGTNGAILYKHRVPYVDDGTYLQTLDIYISSQDVNSAAIISDPSMEIPHRNGPWIVYIHGGAWRDPLVDSSSFEEAAISLFEKTMLEDKPPIAGIVSVNYRLSPDPVHATDPSPPREPGGTINPARIAKHPDHILDVLTGLSYLQTIGALRGGYILAGHSCGATLAFQVVMNQSRWSPDKAIPLIKPQTIVGLNGLYDMSEFLSAPDESHKHLVPVYDAFTRGAFGDDKASWVAVCPTLVQSWEAEWPEGRRVLLAQSRADQLVPYSQTKLMKRNLASCGGSKLVIEETELEGLHNETWEKPEVLVRVLLNEVQAFETQG